jgi:uncharacterized protein (TIGR00661 family)
MKIPVVQLPTLEFVYRNSRAVDGPATAASFFRRLPQFIRSLRQLARVVRETQPDVILNFFEPLTSLYAVTALRRPPVVAVGHQFMFHHPAYIRPPQFRMQQWGMSLYTKILGLRQTRLALSFYEAPDLPEKNITVCPPILRKQLFELTPNPNGDFVLIYLLNHGYAEQISRWSDANPGTKLHCFYDKPEAPAEQAHSASLTFHRLDGEKFLRMMGECKHVVCTAGFESVSEAAWLGKPLILVPVENHVEQQINALDAAQCGFGIAETKFNLDRLKELPATLIGGKFQPWVRKAEAILWRAVERAVGNGSATKELSCPAEDEPVSEKPAV